MSVDRNNKTRLHYILKETYKEQKNELGACQWSLRKLGTMRTLQWRGWKARCSERDTEGVEGWTVRKGDPVLSRIWSLGKVVSSPSRAQGKAPTENKFGYFTAVKYCTGDNYFDYSYVHVLY